MGEISTDIFLSALDRRILEILERYSNESHRGMYRMIYYHLGYDGSTEGGISRGKRIRPQIVLLCTQACGKDWVNALPAAVGVEFIHNFSLIHDDIQDRSTTRRGRPTVWAKWDEAQAINAGDALFTLAYIAVAQLTESYTTEMAHNVSLILQNSCIELTEGQYLDLEFETLDEIDIGAYELMISGKTTALIAGASRIGALLGKAELERVEYFNNFGRQIGLAFQIRDDYLGIWGEELLTGKSISSDLISKKKTFPILYALNSSDDFNNLWKESSITKENIGEFVNLLESSGAKEFTEARVLAHTDKAQSALSSAKPEGEAGKMLFELTESLKTRSN